VYRPHNAMTALDMDKLTGLLGAADFLVCWWSRSWICCN
jgi:hypothetical protein